MCHLRLYLYSSPCKTDHLPLKTTSWEKEWIQESLGKLRVALISWSENKVILRNYEGVICAYTEPDTKSDNCVDCTTCRMLRDKDPVGISKLLAGEKISLVPRSNIRLNRRKRSYC